MVVGLLTSCDIDIILIGLLQLLLAPLIVREALMSSWRCSRDCEWAMGKECAGGGGAAGALVLWGGGATTPCWPVAAGAGAPNARAPADGWGAKRSGIVPRRWGGGHAGWLVLALKQQADGSVLTVAFLCCGYVVCG